MPGPRSELELVVVVVLLVDCELPVGGLVAVVGGLVAVVGGLVAVAVDMVVRGVDMVVPQRQPGLQEPRGTRGRGRQVSAADKLSFSQKNSHTRT